MTKEQLEMTKERLEMTKPSPSKVHFQREWRFLGEINYFCVMNQIPELQALLRAVEERFGEAVKTTAGFERLATSIDFTVGQTLGASTLKRLWGYIPEKTTPRLSTLDILSRYAGYKDFKAFRKTLHAEESSDYVTERTCRYPINAPPTTHKQFMIHMEGNLKTPEFLENTTGLLRPILTFEPLPAWERVRDNLVAKLLSVK